MDCCSLAGEKNIDPLFCFFLQSSTMETSPLRRSTKLPASCAPGRWRRSLREPLRRSSGLPSLLAAPSTERPPTMSLTSSATEPLRSPPSKGFQQCSCLCMCVMCKLHTLLGCGFPLKRTQIMKRVTYSRKRKKVLLWMISSSSAKTKVSAHSLKGCSTIIFSEDKERKRRRKRRRRKIDVTSQQTKKGEQGGASSPCCGLRGGNS